MRTWTLLILLMACVNMCADCLPGVVVFKVLPEYGNGLRLTDSGCGIASLDALLAGLGATAVHPHFRYNPAKRAPGLPDLSLILQADIPLKLDPQGAADLLATDPHVQYAEPVFVYHTLDTPNDPYYAASPYLAAMNAEAAWSVHKGENGAQPVTAAISDTGVRWTHPDLTGNIRQNLGEDADGDGAVLAPSGSVWVMDPDDLNGVDDDGNGFVDDLIGWDFMLDAAGNQGPDPTDGSGHGTRVAGIAGAVTNNALGVASISWNVQLMPLSCTYPGSSSIYRGFDSIIYAAENGADVINASWGGTSFSQAGQEAIDYAWGLGAVIVAAAGNNNNATPLYPAACNHVLAVASVMNDGAKTGVSTYGAIIDVAAPAESIYATNSSSSYSLLNYYTSYACPVAAGLAALVKSYRPEWTNAQVVRRVVACCDNIDAMNPGKENLLGQGMLNAWRALADSTAQPDEELRLHLFGVLPTTDANGNHAPEPGETFSLNLLVKSFGFHDEDVTFTLTESSSAVTVLDGEYTATIPAESTTQLTSAFLVQVSPTATSQYVTFTLHAGSSIPVVAGTSQSFKVLVNAGGMLVWEGANARNFSGVFIRDQLLAEGYPTTYGTLFPPSFHGFDAVFLSFGTPGGACVALDRLWMYEAVRDYLLEGGRLYLEGGDIVGCDMPALPVGADTLAADVLWPLLGIAGALDGDANAMDSLSGEHGWLSNGLLFTGSNQTYTYSIDTYTPGADGVCGFEESDYGITAVQGLGARGQRTFASAYALRELVDADEPNTRAELLDRILAFFTADSLSLPAVTGLTLAADADSLRMAWRFPFPVDVFEVYADDQPDGDFSTMAAQVIAPQWALAAPEAERRFYRVVARRAFGTINGYSSPAGHLP